MYKNDLFRVRIEEHIEVGLVIHVDVDTWTKQTYVHMSKTLKELKEQLVNKGVHVLSAFINPDDPKLEKFASIFGFSKTGVFMTQNDIKVSHEIWQLVL